MIARDEVGPHLSHVSVVGCRGFTLIEVMVAGAILTIGILTLAGMQAIALSKNVNANELTLATNLASDMIERIRFTGDNNSSLVTTLYNGINTSNVATCNAITNTQVQGDCNQWRALLTNSGLNAVRGQVNVVPFGSVAPGANQASQVTVQLNWSGSRITDVGSRVIAFNTVVDPR